MIRDNIILLFLAQYAILTFSVESTVISQEPDIVIPDIDKNQNSTQLLLIQKQDQSTRLIQTFTSKPKYVGEFLHGDDALSVDYHQPKNLVIWSTRNGSIFSTPLTESRYRYNVTDVKLVCQDPRWYPASLAVDYANDRLYVVDTKTNSLHVVDIDDGNRMIVKVGLKGYKPSFVEVDPSAGYVFLLDPGRGDKNVHIIRTDMDGSNVSVLDSPLINAEVLIGNMALDRVNKRILVPSRNQKRVISIDYEGKVGEVVMQARHNVTSLSATRDELYWVYASLPSDAQLHRCNVSADESKVCIPDTMRDVNEHLNRIVSVKAVEPSSQSLIDIGNPCEKVICDHSCLAGSCKCDVGYRLGSDSRSCEYVEEFLLYENVRVVDGLCFERDRDCRPIVPFNLAIRILVEERAGFEYDSTTRKLYYGSVFTIHSINTLTGEKIPLLYQSGVFFGPMALDWVTKNLYYTEIEPRGNISFYTIKVISVIDEDFDRIERSSSSLVEVGKVNSMAVHPYKGYLYSTVYHRIRRNYVTFRMNTDSSGITLIEGLDNSSFVSIDYLENRVYAVNTNLTSIVSTDLDGDDGKILANISCLNDVTGFVVHDGLVYVQNRTNVFKYDKRSGEFAGEVSVYPYGQQMLMGLLVHSRRVHRIDSDSNPCAANNGGCDNFCFAVQRNDTSAASGLERVCKCFDGVNCSG